MGGVVALGECMVEISLTGPRQLALGFAGDVFNTCVYLSRLGVPATFATALGADDPFSAAILEEMRAEGVSDALAARIPGRVPGLYAIERDPSGERRFFYWREQAPVRQFFELADVGAFRASALAADLVYVSGITLAVIGEAGRATLEAILAEAAAAGVPVAFDPNYRQRLWPSREVALAATETMIGHCRIVSASGPDIETLCEQPLHEIAAGWARRGAQVVARAEDGSIEIHTGGAVTRLPAAPLVRAVDTTGAGDSFNAGFLAGWLKGMSSEQATAVGRRLATQVVRHVGAIMPAAEVPPLAELFQTA